MWINPLPLQLPKYKNIISDRTLRRKILNKLKSHSKILRKSRNTWILTPFYLPIYGHGVIGRLNKFLYKTQIQLAINYFLPREYLIYATATYNFLDVIDIINPTRQHKIVFQYADMLSSLRGVTAANFAEFCKKDAMVLRVADLVLCSSRRIFDSLVRYDGSASKMHYFPHGIDYVLFEDARRNPIMIREMEKIAQPVIGYFGSLSDANDKAALKYCAEKRPNWNFVLIGGPLIGDYSMLFQYPNVHFLGSKPHHLIPHYGRYFQVGLLNWLPHDWIKHCYPVKTLEYLALGLPIVSTPIDELRLNFSDFVTFAIEPDDYLGAIEKALQDDSEACRVARSTAVKNETWDSRVDKLREWIEDL